jgi:hypothetical protein
MNNLGTTTNHPVTASTATGGTDEMSELKSNDVEAELLPPSTLDDRLQKLEATLSALQSRAMVPATPSVNEEQLAERVLSVLTAKAAEHRAANGQPAPDGLIPMTQTVNFAPPVPAAWAPPSEQSFWSYFVVGVWDEIKLVARMYFDPRYRLSRVAQIAVPSVAVLFVLNYLFFNYSCFVPFFNLLAERMGYVLLSFALYKVLIREVARYREVLTYLASYGQPRV